MKNNKIEISRRNFLGTVGTAAVGLTIVPGNVLEKALGSLPQAIS